MSLLAACGPSKVATTPKSNDPPPESLVVPQGQASLTIPFHDGAVLRVFGVPNLDETEGRPDFSDAKITLVRFEPTTQESTPLRRIKMTVGGNTSCLYVPFAIAKDDKHVLLSAHMGQAGAGGSMVDLGYGVASLEPGATDEIEFLASRAAFFFDDIDTVVYTTDGDNAPPFVQPGGGSNNAELQLRVFTEKQSRTLFAEPDTTYDLVSRDAKRHSFVYRRTSWTFSAACPREDGALRCAKAHTTTATFRVPSPREK